jgi:hypothetical protein
MANYGAMNRSPIVMTEFPLALLAILLGPAFFCAQEPIDPRSPPHQVVAHTSANNGRRFESQYLTITISPKWKVGTSSDQTLNLRRGKYLLTIDPIFGHASGIIGGRFGEIVGGMPSIGAVMRNVDQPAGGWECAQWPPEEMTITESVSLANLYTDSSKTGMGCSFPSNGRPVWFGSYFSGESRYSEFSITLAYDSANVNSLPMKGSSDLTHIFGEAVAMLKTLTLKPPITVSSIDPQSAPPGATVTIYGSGFSGTAVRFSDLWGEPMADPIVAADGTSLTFLVPTSINIVSCYGIAGRDFCPTQLVNQVNLVENCPRKSNGSANFCGMAIPPATYQLSVSAAEVSSDPVSLTVTAPETNAVSISLVYPNYLVSARDIITVRGSGFTSIGNIVQIGSAVANNVSSLDGKTITFQAPVPAGRSFIRGIRIYKMFVSNANGESNAISFDYR